MSAKTSISELDLICNQSLQAKIELRRSKKSKKDDALKYAAEFLILNKAKLIDANSIDMELAHQKDLQDSFIDRLELNEKRIESMISGLEKVINLDDPVGQITEPHTSPSGFEVSKMRVPLGVIGIIYESRPNVTADASALCLKSGNACILRGGSEAANSNAVIEDCMQKGLEKASLPKHSIQLIKNQDRKVVQEMIKREKDIDLLIPRGGKSLIKVVSDEAKIPVLKHYEGLCHVFIDKDADIKKAVDISVNAKTYRYGICGTMETLLISEDVAANVLPKIKSKLDDLGVEIRGCKNTQEFIEVKSASDEDWITEYLAPILSVKIVADLESAISFINKFGSGHTDSIITENTGAVETFFSEVDSSSVMHNLPTCYADGFEYGLGAEVGISTDKLHARGPVGLEGLTSQKFVIKGQGQLRT
jgi:glutamate-5-semialdehyde dehydrogenase